MTWKRINVSMEVFNDLEKEKMNIERAMKQKASYNDVIKILLGHEKKVYLVQNRARKTMLLEEMKPIIHL